MFKPVTFAGKRFLSRARRLVGLPLVGTYSEALSMRWRVTAAADRRKIEGLNVPLVADLVDRPVEGDTRRYRLRGSIAPLLVLDDSMWTCKLNADGVAF